MPKEFFNVNIKTQLPELSEGHMEIKSYAEELSRDINKKDAKQAVWTEMESVKYIWKKFTPSSERDYKNLHALSFINVYRNVISKASEIFDIPNMLLAGVAFQEYGGAPSFIDPLAYNTRIIVKKSSFLRETFEFT